MGEGKFRGRMYWDSLGTFELAGKPNRGRAGKRKVDVSGWKRKYRMLNEANYDRECAERWGKWGDDEDKGKKENSDSDEPDEE